MNINIEEFISLLNGSSVIFRKDKLTRFAVYKQLPRVAVVPETYEQVSKAVKYCNDNNLSIIPVGSGTKISLGNKPNSYNVAISMEKLNNVIHHNEIDFTVTVQAGAKLERVQQQLIKKNQFIALDPPMTEQGATIGGVISSNDSGPSRLMYKTCKEQILEIKVVRADGSIIRGGAKVVKNVAGYDLPKLFVGSVGTLGIIVEATLKTYPVAEKSVSFIFGVNNVDELNRSTASILDADVSLTALEIANHSLAKHISQSAGLRELSGFAYLTVLKIENVSKSVDEQIEVVKRILKNEGINGIIIKNDDTVWRHIRNFPFLDLTESASCKINVLITDVSKIIEYIEEITKNLNLVFFISAKAGIGSIQTLIKGKSKDIKMCIDLLRSYATNLRGNVIVQKSPGEFDEIDPWKNLVSSYELMKALKVNFDPKNILGPGKLL